MKAPSAPALKKLLWVLVGLLIALSVLGLAAALVPGLGVSLLMMAALGFAYDGGKVHLGLILAALLIAILSGVRLGGWLARRQDALRPQIPSAPVPGQDRPPEDTTRPLLFAVGYFAAACVPSFLVGAALSFSTTLFISAPAWSLAAALLAFFTPFWVIGRHAARAGWKAGLRRAD